MEKRNLVQVQYRGRRSGRFEGDAYTYVADAPLEVGDVVNVPTKYGESEAQVCRINVPEEDIPAYVFRIFCLGGAAGGNPNF